MDLFNICGNQPLTLFFLISFWIILSLKWSVDIYSYVESRRGGFRYYFFDYWIFGEIKFRASELDISNYFKSLEVEPDYSRTE